MAPYTVLAVMVPLPPEIIRSSGEEERERRKKQGGRKEVQFQHEDFIIL